MKKKLGLCEYPLAKSICPNCKMYLFTLKNVFVKIENIYSCGKLRKGGGERRIRVNILGLHSQSNVSPPLPQMHSTISNVFQLYSLHTDHKCTNARHSITASAPLLLLLQLHLLQCHCHSHPHHVCHRPGFKDWKGQRLHDAL